MVCAHRAASLASTARPRHHLCPRTAVPMYCLQYDVVIFITFPEGRNYAPQQLLTLLSSAQHPSQRQLLVVHNPDYLIQNPPISAALLQYAGQPRAAAGAPPRLPPRMQAVVLAPFIAKYTRSLLEAWGRRRSGDKPRFEVPWLPPVVPAAGIDEGVPPSELRLSLIHI